MLQKSMVPADYAKNYKNLNKLVQGLRHPLEAFEPHTMQSVVFNSE
jgi:hypothetical protein